MGRSARAARPRRALRPLVDRPGATARGYDGPWQKLRLLKLRTDPLCEIQTHCGRGIGAPAPRGANEVDHKIPIRQRPDLRLEWNNLQSACRPCHSAKTVRENGGFGR